MVPALVFRRKVWYGAHLKCGDNGSVSLANFGNNCMRKDNQKLNFVVISNTGVSHQQGVQRLQGDPSPQCGNYMISMSLRFYVKSILGISRSAKCALLTQREGLNFNFYEFLHYLKAEIDQRGKSKSSENGRHNSFISSAFSNIDFT